MDFFTGAILSGVVYDMIKCGVMLSEDNLKAKLIAWVIDDTTLSAISNELGKLELTEDLSELAIEKKVLASSEMQIIIKNIQPVSNGNTIIQNNVNGDNIGKNKVINNGI